MSHSGYKPRLKYIIRYTEHDREAAGLIQGIRNTDYGLLTQGEENGICVGIAAMQGSFTEILFHHEEMQFPIQQEGYEANRQPREKGIQKQRTV
jgi:hypothetical protein